MTVLHYCVNDGEIENLTVDIEFISCVKPDYAAKKIIEYASKLKDENKKKLVLDIANKLTNP